MRMYFRVSKSKEKIHDLLDQHQIVFSDKYGVLHLAETHPDRNNERSAYGPIYAGPLFDRDILGRIDLGDSFFMRIKNDAEMDSVEYYFDPHEICKTLKTAVPSYERLFTAVRNKGFMISRTHYSDLAVLSTAPADVVVACILESLKN